MLAGTLGTTSATWPWLMQTFIFNREATPYRLSLNTKFYGIPEDLSVMSPVSWSHMHRETWGLLAHRRLLLVTSQLEITYMLLNIKMTFLTI